MILENTFIMLISSSLAGNSTCGVCHELELVCILDNFCGYNFKKINFSYSLLDLNMYLVKIVVEVYV